MDDIRIGLVGLGHRGIHWLRILQSMQAYRVTAVCDPIVALHEGALSVLDHRTEVTAYAHYEDMLADPKVDAVASCVRCKEQGALAAQALEAGKHVHSEVPAAHTMEDCWRIVVAAERTGLVYQLGEQTRYWGFVEAWRDLVAEGRLGKLQYIYSNRLNLGKVRREENILWSFAPHDISVILSLTQEMPEQVTCQGGNYLHHQIADVTVSTLSFPSGIRSHIFVSWLHPYKEQKLVVVGDKGMAVFDDVEPKEKLKVYPHSIEWRDTIPVPNKAEAKVIEFPDEEPLRAECEHFIQALETRSKPKTDGDEGLAVLRVLDACQKALESGAPASLTVGEKPDPEPDYFAHPTSTIDEPCQIGAGTKVWHYSHVMKDCVIGEKCNLGQNVLVSSGVRLGQNVKVQNNVSVYEGVTCEDHVFLGPSMVFTNVNTPRSEIVRRGEYQETRIKRGATIGANATIVCGNTIGEYALIGAGAVVTKDVRPYALVYGNPARQAGWACRCGVKLDAVAGAPTIECSACRARYELQDGQLHPSGGTT